MRNIPFSPPDMTEVEASMVSEVLDSGWITTGPKTKEFEHLISMCCGTSRTVCLNSATACMEMALRIIVTDSDVLHFTENDVLLVTDYRK